MRIRAQAVAVGVVALLNAGCYHATIETGLSPSQDKISQPWAPSWIYGLVPPPTFELAGRCPNGVAKVETQMSFLNGLVAFLTLSIFTPMQIDVTCSSGTRAGDDGATMLSAGSDPAAALARAAELSRTSRQPVYVKF